MSSCPILKVIRTHFVACGGENLAKNFNNHNFKHIKKIILVIGIIVIIISAGVYIWISSNQCLDGGATWYFDKQFISLKDNDLFKNVVARSSSCAKITYEIKESSLFQKVTKNIFNKFLQDYDNNCSNCLVYTNRSMGQNIGYYNYSTGKEILTQALVANETATWKTYRNEQYGLEMKYPPILKVWENQQSGKAVYGVSFENPLADQTTAGRKIVFSVSVFNNATQLQDAFSTNSDPYRLRIDQGKTDLGGYQAQKLLFKPKNFDDVEATVYLIADKNTAMMVFGTDYHKISEADISQILSTFKFTK